MELQAVVQIQETVAGSAHKVELPDGEFSDCEVEGTPCIQEQAENRLVEGVY